MSGYDPYRPYPGAFPGAQGSPPPGYYDPKTGAFAPSGGGYGPPTMAAGPETRPTVWWFFAVYCGFMGLIYAACLALGVAMIVFAEEMTRSDPTATPEQSVVFGVMLLAIGTPLMVFYLAAPFLPRKKWVWIYGIVAIAIGLTSACTLLAAIPLLIFWLRNDVKWWYRAASSPYG